jgi:SET domain
MFSIKECQRLGKDEQGLFSTQFFSKGEIVYKLTGEILNYPTKYTIHIGNNEHVLDKFGVYMNHSFEPSVEIMKSGIVVAVKDIQVGDEICFDYNHSELKMASPFYANDMLVSGKEN